MDAGISLSSLLPVQFPVWKTGELMAFTRVYFTRPQTSNMSIDFPDETIMIQKTLTNDNIKSYHGFY